jgi:Yos1-like
MLSLFGFGPLIYVSVLLLNAVAILSEDRFLARSTLQPFLMPPQASSHHSKLTANNAVLQSAGAAPTFNNPSRPSDPPVATRIASSRGL